MHSLCASNRKVLTATEIAEAFRRFGIADGTKDLLAIKVGGVNGNNVTASSVAKHLEQNVVGRPVAFSDIEIARMRDMIRLRKIYKIEAPKRGTNVSNSESAQVEFAATATSIALGIMALKGS